MTTKRHLLPTLAVLAPLALPATGLAADTVGSDLSRAGQASGIDCGGPCTLVVDKQGFYETYATSGDIVTSFTARLSSGAHARFKVLRRNPDGTFTTVAESGEVTASGGTQTFKTHLAVPDDGAHTIGMDLLSGTADAVQDDGYELRSVAPPLAMGASGSGSLMGYELMLGAAAEQDADRDGKADESEDDCVYNCGSSGGDNGGGQNGGDDDSGDDIAPPPPTGPSAEDLRFGPAATLRKDGRTLDWELYNFTGWSAKGTLKVTLGGAKFDATKFEVQDRKGAYFSVKLPKPVAKKLRKKGTQTLGATLKLKAGGETLSAKRNLKAIAKGPASPYDGYYRGGGGLVLVVERGVIETVSMQFNAHCSGSGRFESDSFLLPEEEQGPLLLRPDGSFYMKGSEGGGSHTIQGKLTKNGTGKGYISSYYARLYSHVGRLDIDPCLGATNWEAKRTKR